MPIAVVCPNCKANYRLQDDLAGKTVKCQKCQGAIPVPEKASAPTTVLAQKPDNPTQVKTESAVSANAPKKPPKLTKKKDPDKESERDDDAKDRDDDDAPPQRKKLKKPEAKSGGCSGLMIALVLLGGLGVFGCLGCAGAGAWWFYDASQQVAKDLGQIANKDKIDIDGAFKDIKKDDPFKDLIKDDPFKDIKKDDPLKDLGKKDNFKDIMPIKDELKKDLVKDGLNKDVALPDGKKDLAGKDFKPGDGPKDLGVKDLKDGKDAKEVKDKKIEPKGRAPLKVAFDLNNIYETRDLIAPTDPLNHAGQAHHAYLVFMQEGGKYRITLTSSKKFKTQLYVLDDANAVVAESPGGRVISFSPLRTGTYRVEAASFAGLEGGSYVFRIDRAGAVFVDKGKDDGPGTKTDFGELTQSSINFKISETVLDSVVWLPDGKAFFALTGDGVLQRFDSATLKVEKKTDLARKCLNLAMSAEGLLVSVRDAQEVWVIDPDNLDNVKAKISVPALRRVVAGASSSMAVAASGGGGKKGFGKGGRALAVIDLKKGEVAATYDNFASNFLVASADGKLYFAEENSTVKRYRLVGEALVFEEDSYGIGQNPQTLSISPDGVYVALPSGGGNTRDHPDHPPIEGYSTYVYPAWNLKRPVFAVSSGAYPQALGFDAKIGYVYAQNSDHSFMVFTFTGIKRGELNLNGFSKGGDSPREFSVSPQGGQVVVRGNKTVVHVKIAGKTEPVPKLEIPPDPIVKIDPKKDPKNAKAADVKTRIIPFDQPLAGVVWARDGKSCYVVTNNTHLRRVDCATGATLKEHEFGNAKIQYQCTALAMSGEGLVLTIRNRQQVWVVDPENLGTIKKIITVQDMARIGAGVSSKYAITSSTNGAKQGLGVDVIDLQKGGIVRSYRGAPAFNEMISFACAVGGDGKALYAKVGSTLQRFDLVGDTVRPGQTSYKICDDQNSNVRISPDGQFVCLAAFKGNTTNHPDHPPPSEGMQTLYIYPADNLRRPAATIEGKDIGSIIGIDPKAGFIYVTARNAQLLFYTFGGACVAQGKFNGLVNTTVQDLAVSPNGGELIVMHSKDIACIKVNMEGEPVVKVDPKKKDGDPKKDPGKAVNIEAKDVTYKVIAYKPNEAPAKNPVWAADGKSFFVLTKNGNLQRINADTDMVEKEHSFNRTFGLDAHLDMCSEGLVLTSPEDRQVWLIDPDNPATIKKKLNVGDIARVAVGRDAKYGMIAVRGAKASSLRTVDFETGALGNPIPTKVQTFNMRLSADGKTLLQGDTGRILRYKFDGQDLFYEEGTASLVAAPGFLHISPDGQFVCFAGGVLAPPAGFGERGMYVFSLDNLKKPIATITKLDPGKAVGIDSKGGWIYANESKKPLVIFNSAGVRKGEFAIPEIADGSVVSEYIIAPQGQAFLIRTPGAVIHVKIEVAGVPLAMSN